MRSQLIKPLLAKNLNHLFRNHYNSTKSYENFKGISLQKKVKSHAEDQIGNEMVVYTVNNITSYCESQEI